MTRTHQRADQMKPERVSLAPLTPEDALRALLAIDPNDAKAADDEADENIEPSTST